MITTIAEIRARHSSAVPASMQGLPPPPIRNAPSEAAEWVATVGRADITRTRRSDGGYQLYVGARLVAVVEGADKEGRHVVINHAAGRVRSHALARNWADTLALRIARNEALA